MASDKQIAASRANGARSRGPATPEGKLRSSRSNAEQGLLARTVVLDGESRERFRTLITSLHEELQPETAIENLLIHKMAVAHWRMMRVWGMEKAATAHEASAPGIADAPTRDALAFGKSSVRMNQYEMRFDRQFTRALDHFERFRASRTRQAPETKGPEADS